MFKGLMELLALVLAFTVLRSESGAQSSATASAPTNSSPSQGAPAQAQTTRNAFEVLSGASNAGQAGFSFAGGLSEIPADVPASSSFAEILSLLSSREKQAISILPLTAEEKPRELPVFGSLQGDPIAVGDGILLIFRKAVFHSEQQATLYFEVVTQNGHLITSHRKKLGVKTEFYGAEEPPSIINPGWSTNPSMRRRFPAYAEVFRIKQKTLHKATFVLTYVDWMTEEQKSVDMYFPSLALTSR